MRPALRRDRGQGNSRIDLVQDSQLVQVTAHAARRTCDSDRTHASRVGRQTRKPNKGDHSTPRPVRRTGFPDNSGLWHARGRRYIPRPPRQRGSGNAYTRARGSARHIRAPVVVHVEDPATRSVCSRRPTFVSMLRQPAGSPAPTAAHPVPLQHPRQHTARSSHHERARRRLQDGFDERSVAIAGRFATVARLPTGSARKNAIRVTTLIQKRA